jgi:uncharacterized membrane protein YgcG
LIFCAQNDIRARSTHTTEILQKAYTEERSFLEHVRTLKGSFTTDRGMLEQEIARVRQAVMQERAMREEAVRRENAILSRYRASEGGGGSRFGGGAGVTAGGGQSDHLYM